MTLKQIKSLPSLYSLTDEQYSKIYSKAKDLDEDVIKILVNFVGVTNGQRAS